MSNGFLRVAYADQPETAVYRAEIGSSTVNKILLGTWVGVVEDNGGERVRVVTAGPDGWVERDELRDDCGLKIFFVDVGQGDGVLVEAPGRRLLIDGGPNTNLRRYLRGYQYRHLLDAGASVHIDTVFVSHFDADHFKGLTDLLEDDDFTFGDVFHNGIARFSSRRSDRPSGYNEDLGRVSNGVLRTTFNDLDDARALLAAGGLQSSFRKFLQAAVDAEAAGRLGSLRRLTVRNGTVPGYPPSSDFTIEVLGPVPRLGSGTIDWPWFSSSSQTRNGHSLVLKLRYGDGNGNERTFLLGGDLNSESEDWLIAHYGQQNPFRVDVAKSCHHGSADFTVEFMDRMSPFATVISSGDNESYAHPRAEAVGCAGRYSRGTRPLVFSTELARSVRSGGDILYGLINCRSDGSRVVFAQMKERATGADIWDSYEL